MAGDDRWVTSGTAARMLGLSVENLRYLADEGRIPVARLDGGPRWFRVGEVRKLGVEIRRRRECGLLPGPARRGGSCVGSAGVGR